MDTETNKMQNIGEQILKYAMEAKRNHRNIHIAQKQQIDRHIVTTKDTQAKLYNNKRSKLLNNITKIKTQVYIQTQQNEYAHLYTNSDNQAHGQANTHTHKHTHANTYIYRDTNTDKFMSIYTYKH